MAESIPVLPESASDTGTYRPLSGLAMASIVIAGFYALIVLAFASLSFVSGTPVFLPPWGLVAPVTAIDRETDPEAAAENVMLRVPAPPVIEPELVIVTV